MTRGDLMPGNGVDAAFIENHMRTCKLLPSARCQLCALVRELETRTRERDDAVAHDRQAYPTAWAYEQACKTIERLKHDLFIAKEAEAGIGRQYRDRMEQVEQLREEVGELRRALAKAQEEGAPDPWNLCVRCATAATPVFHSLATGCDQ